jgi:hypothetical protein
LKKQLIILSLSPLFLLTILQYFPFEKFGCVVGNLFNIQIIYKHLPLYIGMWICLIWVIVSLIIFIKFVCFLNTLFHEFFNNGASVVSTETKRIR